MLFICLLAVPLLATFASAHDGINDGHPNEITLPPGLLKIQEYRDQLAASLTFLAAFLAGIISFTSPCGFVLLPTFFTFLFKERKRAVLMTAIFALGMMLGFVTLGIGAAFAGSFINQYRQPFAIVSGIVFILFGLMALFGKGFSLGKAKMHGKTPWGLLLFGFAFAFGWSPCIGPVLGGILLLAATTGSVLKGAIMLALFALGVALPMLIVASLSDKFDFARWSSKTWKLFGKEVSPFNVLSGAILIFIGIIMITWKGTAFFELTVTKFVPWSMDLFYNLNDSFIQGAFTSSWAQLLGLAFGLAVFGWIVWKLRPAKV